MLNLLEQVPSWNNARIFLPGAGTSVLVDRLLQEGAFLVLNDLSAEAMGALRKRIMKHASRIEEICQDIAEPLGAAVKEVDIWIDRAVLHFLTGEADISGYFHNVSTTLRVGGHALFAEFPAHGYPQCAGLKIHRYTIEELSERMGEDYQLQKHFDHTFINPNGDSRPYIYALFKRIK